MIAIVRLKSLFKIDHKIYGKKIFGKNFKNHSYYSKFKKENYAFIDLEYIKLEKKNLKDKNFVPPIKFKKRINFKNKKKKSLAGFHTRNVPHSAHQWIHQFLIKKYSNILIQPLIGQYKKNEYLDQIIKKTNLIAIKMYPRKKAFYLPYFSYPRYGGPLEASLHAIVRKNYGCTHFGRKEIMLDIKIFIQNMHHKIFVKKIKKDWGLILLQKMNHIFVALAN